MWRTRIACWIPKATNKHLGCVIPYRFSTQAVVARTRLNVALHVQYIACFVTFHAVLLPTPPPPHTHTHTCVGNTHARAKEGWKSNIKRNLYIYLHKSNGDLLEKQTVVVPSSFF